MPDFWLSYVLVFALALGLGLFPSFGFTSPLDSVARCALFGLPAGGRGRRAHGGGVLAHAARRRCSTSSTASTSSPRARSASTRSRSSCTACFRNALIPYVTIIGLQIRYILGGVVVVERIFGVPGSAR